MLNISLLPKIMHPVSPLRIPMFLFFKSNVISKGINTGFDTWHKRLGHPSAIIVRKALVGCNLLNAINENETLCEVYQKGIATSCSFQVLILKYMNPLNSFIIAYRKPLLSPTEMYTNIM